MIEEIIETERLVLRYMKNEDAQTIYDIWSNPKNARFMDAPKDLEDVRKTADWENGHILTPKADCHFRVVTLKSTGEVIGSCRFHFFDDGKQMGFGYNLSETVWGQGYASELLRALIKLAKENGVKKLNGGADKENVSSCHVLEKYMKFVGEEPCTESDGREVIDRNYELTF